jgi:hypothetical protein
MRLLHKIILKGEAYFEVGMRVNRTFWPHHQSHKEAEFSRPSKKNFHTCHDDDAREEMAQA